MFTQNNTTNERPNVVTGSTTPVIITSRNSARRSIIVGMVVASESVTKKITVEMNGLRMDKTHWLNDGLHNHHE